MSDLLKMYRVLEDDELAKRVQGAVVKKAHYDTANQDADSESKAFAALVLEEPFRQWRDFHLEAAANASVLGQVTLSRDRQTAYTHDVKDADLEYIVGVTWQKVAAKYTAA